MTESSTSISNAQGQETLLRIDRERAQQLFPIAPSDRRKHADLLAPALDRAALLDDDAFYATLADLLDAPVPHALVEYDRRMQRAGKASKQFSARLLRELGYRGKGAPADPKNTMLVSGKDDPTLQDLLDRFRNALEQTTADAEGTTETRPVDEPDDAVALVGTIRDVLDHAGDPMTVAEAGRVRALAELLVEACHEIETRSDARHDALLDRLGALPGPSLAPPARNADAATFDRIEALLSDAERAGEACTLAKEREGEARKALRLAATDSEQDARMEAVLASAQGRREADALAGDALDALAAVLTVADTSAPRADADADLCPQAVVPESPPDAPEPVTTVEPELPAPSAPSAQAAQAAVAARTDPPARPETPIEETVVEDVPRRAPVRAQPAPAPDPSPDPVQPAAAHPRRIATVDTDDLLLTYLHADEMAFAWHVARIAEASGADVALPAPVLEVAVLGPAVSRPEDIVDPSMAHAFTEAARLSVGAQEEGAALLLTFGGLLRPALFDMHQAMRTQIGNLPRSGVLAPYAPLIDALATLGFEVQLSIGLLAEMDGAERQSRLPHVLRGLRDWLEQKPQRTTLHQPTSFILKRELTVDGVLGEVLAMVLDEKPGAERVAREFVETYSGNRSAQEGYVFESERRAGRSRRKKITGAALDWYCRALQEACDHLARWMEARSDAQMLDVGRRETLKSSIGAVRKAVRLILEEEPDKDARPGTLEGAAHAFVHRAVKDLRDVLDEPRRRRAELDREALLQHPRLRLPGGAQDWTMDESVFDAERESADRVAFETLRGGAGPSADYRTAFFDRSGEGAIRAAAKLLHTMVGDGLDPEERLQMEQDLDEARAERTEAARARIAPLRQKLTSLIWLETDKSEDVQATLARMERIVDDLAGGGDGRRHHDVPPDFPQLDRVLDDVEAFCESLTSDIRTTQRAALEMLKSDPDAGAGVAEYLDRIEEIDPVTIDNDIAGFRSGQTVTPRARTIPDPFRRFFPGFVEEIDADPKLARGTVISTVQRGGTMGMLDFAALDTEARTDAVRLLESWGAMENALRKPARRILCEQARVVFEAFGFSSVSVEEDRDLVRKKLQTLRLTCDTPSGARWFLPPSFGTLAQGYYPVVVAQGLSNEDLVARLGELGRDRPFIVLFFGRIGREQRAKLGRALRREAQMALVIDETLLFWLVMNHEERLKTLFACALPFGWLQPYTTSAGQIPREMFFGRRDEIEKVTEMSNRGCLIYGGRQLGKSALLYHIREREHRPAGGRLALYIDIKNLGQLGQPSDGIWGELDHKLRVEDVTTGRERDPGAIVEAIERWIDAEPGRRILAMFDEADEFLSAEHRNGNVNLGRLKTLMERTDRRFKVVFAGLHNVRRMADAPNSPLPHLGEPICIGPMNSTNENRAELLRLAVEPMRAAGLDYADPYLMSDMLTRMNFYPSLVQIFGHTIVEKMGRKPDPTVEGPRWMLERVGLFEGETGQAIFSEIRKRFHLTLRLDPRYELIVKCIALMRFEDRYGLDRSARTLDEIERYIADWWPDTLPRADRGDLRELLKEMVDLGVLGGFGDGRFGLRNAHIAQLLGRQEQLETEILELNGHESKVDYDGGLYHRSLRPVLPEVRAPLPDRMLDAMFEEREHPLTVVTGSPAIAGPRIAERLVVAADLWNQDGSGGGARRMGVDQKEIGGVLRHASPPSVLMIDGAWDAQVAGRVIAQPAVQDGRTIVVWVDDAIRGRGLTRLSIEARALGAVVLRCRPWSDLMIRHWLRDSNLDLDDRETRAMLMQVSGGIPERLSRMEPMLEKLATQPIAVRREHLEDWAAGNPLPSGAIEIDAPDIEALRAIVEEEETEETTRLAQISILCETATQETIDRLISLDLVREGAEADGRGLLPTPLGRLLLGS